MHQVLAQKVAAGEMTDAQAEALPQRQQLITAHQEERDRLAWEHGQARQQLQQARSRRDMGEIWARYRAVIGEQGRARQQLQAQAQLTLTLTLTLTRTEPEP